MFPSLKKGSQTARARIGGEDHSLDLPAGPFRDDRRVSIPGTTIISNGNVFQFGKPATPPSDDDDPFVLQDVLKKGAKKKHSNAVKKKASSAKPSNTLLQSTASSARKQSAAVPDNDGRLFVGPPPGDRRSSVMGGKGPAPIERRGSSWGGSQAAGRRGSVMPTQVYESPKLKEVVTFAVVVGIDWYEDFSIPSCDHAVRDAKMVAKQLERSGYTVELLVDDAEAPTMRPTQDNIYRALQEQKMRSYERDREVNREREMKGDPAIKELPVLFFACGRGNILKGADPKDARPFLLPCDAEAAALTPQSVLTFEALRFVGGPELVIALDLHPCLRGDLTGAESGVVCVSAKGSIGGEFKAVLPKSFSARLLSLYFLKGMIGGALRESKVTTNTLNVFLAAKLGKHKAACTTNSGSLLMGSLALAHGASKTKQAIKEEQQITKITPRRFSITAILPLEFIDPDFFRPALTGLCSKLLKPLNEKLPNRSPTVKFQYQYCNVTHFVLVLQGSVDEVLQGDARRRLDTIIQQTLVRPTNPGSVVIDFDLFYTGSLGPRSASLYTTLGIPCTLREAQLLAERFDAFRYVGTCEVVNMRVKCVVGFTGCLYDYIFLDKRMRLGHWERNFVLLNIHVEDPANNHKHESAAKIQSVFRGRLGRGRAHGRAAFHEEEKARRRQIAAEWHAGWHEMIDNYQSGSIAVLVVTEREARRDKIDWEKEERIALWTSMRRVVGRMESATRSLMEVRFLFELRELLKRFEVAAHHTAFIGRLHHIKKFLLAESQARSLLASQQRREFAELKSRSIGKHALMAQMAYIP